MFFKFSKRLNELLLNMNQRFLFWKELEQVATDLGILASSLPDIISFLHDVGSVIWYNKVKIDYSKNIKIL